MNACRTNRERLRLFLCRERPILGAVLPGPPVARTTYSSQTAHHFQQKNRRELAC